MGAETWLQALAADRSAAFASCPIIAQVKDVARPMMKCLAVLLVTLAAIVLVPMFSLWLPIRLGS